MAAFRSSGAMPFWACTRFFGWCEDRGLTLTTIRPFDVAAWIEQLQEKQGAAGVKQQLAAVRGPKRVVKTGKTPVLDAGEWRRLIDSIPIETVRDLRDRA